MRSGGVARSGRALLAVDGVDGSGKSRFAEALAAACAAEGRPAVLMHVDDFRRPVDWGAPGTDEAALYYDRYYDLAMLDGCLRAFLDGAARTEHPRFDSTRDALDGTSEVRFGDAPLCIVEGVFVLRVEAAAAAPLVSLEVSESEATRRILDRDAARGRPLDVVRHRLTRRYQPAQSRYRAAFDPAGRADVLVDNERWDRPRMLRRETGRLPPGVAEALLRVIPP
jgi:uridine kinase